VETFPHAFLVAKAGLLAAARSAPTETPAFMEGMVIMEGAVFSELRISDFACF